MFAIGAIDPYNSSLITFDLENHVPCLPYQISFLIQVLIKGKTIHRTIIDEGALSCIISFSCWKGIGSPPLNQSPNTLEAFDGKGSRPYIIFTNLPITFEGNTIKLEVQVVDVNLNYNLLLGRRWTHAMFCVVSSFFRVLHFPHEGKIVTVDQLPFFYSGSLNANVPYVGNTEIPYESVGAHLFKDSTLMGILSLPPPNVHPVNMISDSTDPCIIRLDDQID